jgi:hypothetical protein
MGHIPEDDNYNEWMDASAEEWSKPQEPSSPPPEPQGETDRWGSPISDKEVLDDPTRWGSEAPQPKPEIPTQEPTPKKGSLKWWIILIIVAVVLCLCACVVLAGLQIFNVVDMFQM